jgi:hypothetical protein
VPATQLLRVADFDIRIFRPAESTQVSADYYAVDLALRLKSASGGNLRVVCRFPSVAISPTLLDEAKQLLSSRFEIRRFEQQQATR